MKKRKSMPINSMLTAARSGAVGVDDIATLAHFFPCLNKTKLIDTKGGITYTPTAFSYDSINNTFQGLDGVLQPPNVIDSGTPHNFGTNSFGVLVVGTVTADSGVVNNFRIGNWISGSPQCSITMGSNTSNGGTSGGFNDVGDAWVTADWGTGVDVGYHYTARPWKALTVGQTYAIQLTVDRANNIMTYKHVDITSGAFADYTLKALLPVADATITSQNQIDTAATDMGIFNPADTVYTYMSDTSGAVTKESGAIVINSMATDQQMIFTGTPLTNSTGAADAMYITDGISATRQYPDYGNSGSLSSGANARDIQNALAVTPESYMTVNNYKLYGAAFFDFAGGIPTDWNLACDWMAANWVNGDRFIYPAASSWT